MKRVIIIGGGASVKEGIEKNLWDNIKGENIWSINYSFMKMPYLPQREVWIDGDFFKENADTLQKLYESGVKMVTKEHFKHTGIKEFTTQYKETRERKAYNPHDTKFMYSGTMGLSGFFALSIAIAEGYDEIFLLGYDFGTASIKERFTHFYQNDLKVYSKGVNRPEVYRMPNNTVKREVNDFSVYRGVKAKIWNVSENSNIQEFEKISYETFFDKLKKEG